MDDLKITLDRLEADLVDLKLQYDLFFQGGRRGEPAKERKELEISILSLSRRSIINSTDQLRFSNLQGKFWSFVHLWARLIRDLEEGRLRRDKTGGLTRQGTERIPAGRPANPEPFDPGHIDRVAQELLEARRSCGISGDASELASLRDTLQSRAKEISASSGGKKVEFRVSVEDGKPKVKASLS